VYNDLLFLGTNIGLLVWHLLHHNFDLIGLFHSGSDVGHLLWSLPVPTHTFKLNGRSLSHIHAVCPNIAHNHQCRHIIVEDQHHSLSTWGQNGIPPTEENNCHLIGVVIRARILGIKDMTKTLNQIIFFSSTKTRIFFSATLGIRIFFLEKTLSLKCLSFDYFYQHSYKHFLK
jgi:hypothetical protein